MEVGKGPNWGCSARIYIYIYIERERERERRIESDYIENVPFKN
jgi:hypothetical protein